ncbi:MULTISPECIES: glycerol-3-phosphate dehydrogenase/oxidase [unclassified Shewanella]|uniref:glycerol-3-phosphate dehydrogenase/oxidase n=1 Tax=unclassified Shewanella TaxID=196818 RepID=UPI001BC2781E|nr:MULTISPECIES: FAD-dependent oxidoreductase [unclassified Shewanella]GIU07074.1 FAD-dependent oxidoreductase [Shewanella sp. MBTL60-112-B1]GIU35441.1 FAD-dependent oxidoreductase [Shewanella sp. MBTL60-112-B2]
MATVDLLVIGGGINGAGIAQCAAAAGYSVLLLEKETIAAQTSANSSKLIHGGLRYLESGQLPLVRKSLAERKALLKLAPNLVSPIPFYIPVYENSRRSPWAIRAGLSLYAMLSDFDALGQFKSVPSVHWSKIKGLKLKGLKAVYQYWDAQTDDKMLTQAVIKNARSLGADVLEHAQCTHIEHLQEQCLVRYQYSSMEHQVEALAVVNTAGPWVNQVLETVFPPITSVPIEWVQGSHLLLDIPANDGILYLESCFDKRVVFVMPWKGRTLIGTTETVLASLDSQPKVTPEEVDYLLGIYSHYFSCFGDVNALKERLLDSFCGVRVLPEQAGTAFDRPRDTILKTQPSHPNLLSLYGGKLTTYRSTATEVIEWLEQTIGDRQTLADFDTLRLD